MTCCCCRWTGKAYPQPLFEMGGWEEVEDGGGGGGGGKGANGEARRCGRGGVAWGSGVAGPRSS